MLIKRTTKGSPLTYQEMDDNLDYLEGLTQQTFADILATGNITNGNDVVISQSDTLDVDGILKVDGTTQINGDLLSKSTVYTTTSNVSRITSIHEIDITSQIELTMFEASGYERINFIKVDGTTNDALINSSGQDFIVNGVQVNQLTLSNFDSITLWYSKTQNLWFEVK